MREGGRMTRSREGFEQSALPKTITYVPKHTLCENSERLTERERRENRRCQRNFGINSVLSVCSGKAWQVRQEEGDEDCL